ncbi:FAD/NAD-P-binding domain-containing protein [Crucibulum laeve]|uniref:FAD/NAD-P-binding domain-containing protein n=1 Tax=Crucibulum laeve TaxID=68775 RepID=A0A5C3LXL3_9AGAR|nr:FAD/NAD-P-binding domain-containing protein [Crucibulum laeve]
MAFLDERIGIIGAGAAGLITAHVLLQDGFTNVQIFTRDKSAGGVWARERIYPGLVLNNVHGEFRFSPLDMPPPANAEKIGGRLSGYDMAAYMEKFADTFLKGKIRFHTEVLNVRRGEYSPWVITVSDVSDVSGEDLPDDIEFDKVVVCTGGCSTPKIPEYLSQEAANKSSFNGLILHSNQFGAYVDEILSRVKPAQPGIDTGSVVIVGGGRSAQDMATYLANEGRKVTVVFEKIDAFLATSRPLPEFIRKSRFLSILSPHIELRTRLERFLHGTWLGSKIVHFVWDKITSGSFSTYSIPPDSPLRHAHSLFWAIRTNDEGGYRPNSFHALVTTGKIEALAPARVVSYGVDGHSVVLNDGRVVKADIVILATGYTSSWGAIFDEKTVLDLGLERHPPQLNVAATWDYPSLANPPITHPNSQQWSSSIYRGIVPAKTIDRRDFAINGAVFSANNGYTYEVVAHWISSYFLKDNMRISSSPQEAVEHAERNSAWMKKRYPGILTWANESYSAALPFWNWPQATDELLDDMFLSGTRSGGNWLTWPFKVIDLQEIANLKEERRALRIAQPI